MITLDAELLQILACPACRSELRAQDSTDELACTSRSCGLVYPVRDEIPVLLVEEARQPDPPEEQATSPHPAAPGSAAEERPTDAEGPDTGESEVARSGSSEQRTAPKNGSTADGNGAATDGTTEGDAG